MTAVTNWTAGFLTGLTAGLTRLFSAVPAILGALVLLLIGWIIAGILGSLVTKLCRAIHVDRVADRIGVNGFFAKSGTRMTASSVLGEILKWAVRLVFIEMAAEQLGMPQITVLINQILGFIPNIIVALIILGVGAFLGQILSGLVRGTIAEAKAGNADIVARVTYGAIMAFAIIMALNELNVAPVVVNTLFIGLVAALALALGLAFGLGGRDAAAELTNGWVAQAKDTAQKLQSASSADHSALPNPPVSRQRP